MPPHSRFLPLILGVAAAAACSRTGAEPEIDPTGTQTAAGVTVTLGKAAYARAELDRAAGGIRARIANGADRPYYSRLGDAFNAAVEQDPLFVALGSDAVLERADDAGGATWAAVPTVVLVEGVREVRLAAGASYGLHVLAGPAVAPGRYRVAVSVRGAPGAAVAERVTSAPFEVR